MDNVGKKCLITGANGFIGKHLRQYLLENDHSIRAISRVEQAEDSTIEWKIADIIFPETLNGVCDGVDTVFHLAGFAHAWEEEDAYFAKKHQQINLQGTLNLAKEAQKAGVKRFIFISTIKACADSEDYCDESWQNFPHSAYGLAKRHAEEKLLELYEQSSMEVIILRPTLVYGVGWKGNLSAMLKATSKGYFPPPPPVENKKSMVSVHDLCRAMVLAATAPLPEHRIFIVSDGKKYSTREIYLLMRKALAKTKNRLYLPLWSWHVLAKCGDLGKAILKRRLPIDSQMLNKLLGNMWYGSAYIEKELGFIPQETLKDVLPKIIKDSQC